MKVAVFGANGYLGSLLCTELNKQGFEIVKFSHQKDSEKSSIFEIFEPKFPSNPEFDHAIYLSWRVERDRRNQMLSYDTADKFSCWSAKHGIRVLFLSTMAAKPPQPKSNYGFWKKQAESSFEGRGHSILRVATVINHHSTSGTSLNLISSSPLMLFALAYLLDGIRIPVTLESEYIKSCFDFVNQHSDLRFEAYSNITTIQELFGLKCGPIKLKTLEKFAGLLPISIRDRLYTIFDVQLFL